MLEAQSFDNYADRAYVEGNALLESGELEKAIECYNCALRLDCGFTSAMFYKGVALVSLRRYDEAIMCYDLLLVTEPGDVEALEHKGVALIEISRYEEALKCYKKALELAPRNGGVLLKIGYIYQTLGNFADALKYFEMSLECESGDKRTWYMKGISLAEQGYTLGLAHKFREALKCFDRALEICPGDVDVLKDKAKALLAIGESQAALDCYLTAIAAVPEDPSLIAALAKTYKLMNMQKESLFYYKKLLELNCDGGAGDDAERVKAAINKSR